MNLGGGSDGDFIEQTNDDSTATTTTSITTIDRIEKVIDILSSSTVTVTTVPTTELSSLLSNNHNEHNNNTTSLDHNILFATSKVMTPMVSCSHEQQQKMLQDKYNEVIQELRSIQHDLMIQQQQQQQQQQNIQRRRRHRSLEEENDKDQQNQDNNNNQKNQNDADDNTDDYFNYYNVYHSSSTANDVEITFDEEDNTIVTVGDDVIVLVDHNIGFYIYNVSMILICIVIGATMAGLLMGVMSLDPLLISIKARTAATYIERKQALSLLPFVQNKNLVLVSLLLVNCGTNEALPVFLDTLLENPFITVLLSLTVVVIIGEILPSAYFTGRDQVKCASELIPVLRFVIILTSPISYPLAKIMDHYFHPSEQESSAMKRGEITAMVRIQYEERLAWKRRQAEELNKHQTPQIDNDDDMTTITNGKDNNNSSSNKSIGADTSTRSVNDTTASISSRTNSLMKRFQKVCDPCEPLSMLRNTELYACVSPNYQCQGIVISNIPSYTNTQHEDLGNDDIMKLEGALSMKDKRVKCAYTPMNRVVSVMADAILDENMVVQIYSHGYSRVPVMQYLDETKTEVGICGIVLTKQLMLIGKEDQRRISTLTLYEPPCVSPKDSLADALSIILTGKRKSSHMALVCINPEIAKVALQNKIAIPIEAGVLGIITLDNILEELIQEPILDEKDKKMNRKLERAKWVITKWKAFMTQKRQQRQQQQQQDKDNARNTSILHMDNSFDYVTMNELV